VCENDCVCVCVCVCVRERERERERERKRERDKERKKERKNNICNFRIVNYFKEEEASTCTVLSEWRI